MTQHIDPDSPIAHEAAQMAQEILSAGLLLQVDRILEGPIFEAGMRVFDGSQDPFERTTYFTCLLASMVRIAAIAAATNDRLTGAPLGDTLAGTIKAAKQDGWTF